MKFIFMIAIASISASAFAFDSDGFKSGMTKDQVSRILTERHLPINSYGENDLFVSRAVASDAESGPFFGFCGNKLSTYHRLLPFDENLIPVMDSLVRDYGAPSKSETFGILFRRNGDASQKGFRVVWEQGGEFIFLNIIPEIRDQRQSLLIGRRIEVNLEDRRHCT